jgi:hypothetical protein
VISPKINTPRTAKMKKISIRSEKTLKREGSENIIVCSKA